jgi:hypothetical protein
VNDHLGLGHLVESDAPVGPTQTRLLEASPGSFCKPVAHQVVVDRDRPRLDSASQGIGPR